jgi:CRISPR-associated protein Cmr6
VATEKKLMPNNKPVLKSPKQKDSRKNATAPVKKQLSKKDDAKKKQPLNIQSADANAVPLMFQAQIEDRGNIQFVGDKKNKQTGQTSQEKPGYERWVSQWLEACPPSTTQLSSKTKPSSSRDNWQKALANLAVADTNLGIIEVSPSYMPPWEYQVRWRIVMNSGQDTVIRPVIGKKGIPFFPGSSMKGAFRNACPESQRMRYCGGEVTKNGKKFTNPGILRFHGGYPTDMSWRNSDRLVDIVHGQENYQVRDSEARHNANVQISLYRPKIKFDMSSTKILSSQEWDEVKEIWERALGFGIGSRISAGYGYMEEVKSSNPSLFSIHLNGQGITSQLLLPGSSKTAEFRPNMFKAALRGHTWRLLAGITDVTTAQVLTHKLWGGIEGGAIEGCIGIDFYGSSSLSEHSYKVPKQNKRTGEEYSASVLMPTYDLKDGRLDLLQVSGVTPELKEFVTSLIKFSMLLGGFGKSWRRVHHKLFYQDYLNRGDKPMIGCHWEFANQSKEFYIPTDCDDLSEIRTFLAEIREQAIAWVQSENLPRNGYEQNWRETWHPDKVQVWGRIAKDAKSQAVRWFHDKNCLQETSLAGRLGQIGRTWHRMYPRYAFKDGELKRLDKDYVELLTIFPDSSEKSQKFMTFLATEVSQFQKLWPCED